MKSSPKKRKIRRESEAQLYEPTKEALELLFSKKRFHLEITANRQLPEAIKKILSDYNLFANIVERFVPDLTGYVEESAGKSLVVVEVKPGVPKMKDIFQAKEYAEIFGAKHAFLISPQALPEEIRRILEKKGEILSHTRNAGMILVGQLHQNPFESKGKVEVFHLAEAPWLINNWYPKGPTV